MLSDGSRLPGLGDLEKELGGIKGKKILLRCDLNVPIADGIIQDEYRIQTSLPTIEYLLEADAQTTICSHLGRPPDFEFNSKFSLEPVKERLFEILAKSYPQIGSSIDTRIEVRENLRFSRGETECSEEFILEMIEGKDAYVNDAFGACHRDHASIVGPPRHLPSVAGRLLEKEVGILDSLLENPKRPLVIILGGAKVSDKLPLIKSLLETADSLAIGGAMAFSFLAASGSQISEMVDEKMLPEISGLLKSSQGKKIHLPLDLAALDAKGEVRQMRTSIPEDCQPRDIGPGTAAEFCELIERAATVFWNGPVGVFEDPRFEAGTRAVAEAVAEANAFSVVGGGDSASAVRKFGLEKDINHLSTGGGATLKYLEKTELPGIAALLNSSEIR